jgi:hypothetical protein
VRVPAIDRNAAGDVFLHGAFELGPGTYHVDWLMRDRGDRVCSAHWEVTAVLSPKDRLMPLPISPGQVLASEGDTPFDLSVLNSRSSSALLRISVVVNLVGVDSGTGGVRSAEPRALLGIVRTIADEPRTAIGSLTAVDILGREILYRGSEPGRLDLPALARAFRPERSLTVDFRNLGRDTNESDFLASVIADEIRLARPAAIILISPRLSDTGVMVRSLLADAAGDAACPIFYMGLELDGVDKSWPDSIATVVKRRKGIVYNIREPRDLMYAWNDVIRRMFD